MKWLLRTIAISARPAEKAALSLSLFEEYNYLETDMRLHSSNNGPLSLGTTAKGEHWNPQKFYQHCLNFTNTEQAGSIYQNKSGGISRNFAIWKSTKML